MFFPPMLLQSEIFSIMPEGLHLTEKPSRWVTHRAGGKLHSFLEGPSFDRQGNLYCVDLAHGRIFRISRAGEWEVFADYDGEPNGLKLHRDGRIFVADRSLGLLSLDPGTAEITFVCSGPAKGERFNALNDLTFARNGDIFVTDQGDSSLDRPFGRVFRIRATGEIDLIMGGLESPNGLVLSHDETVLYVAITRANRLITIPLRPNHGGINKAAIFVQLSGGLTGPDGMALDAEGGLAVVHGGFGTVWIFNRFGEPLYRVKSCTGIRTTNVAYGGIEGTTLFITEAEQAAILKVDLPVSGATVFGLS